MRRLLVVALVLAACGGGTDPVEAELAAATFVVEMPATGVMIVGNDRLATASEIENRLEVIRPEGEGLVIGAVYESALVPDPFEFVRDPLAVGSLAAFLEPAERVIGVLHPLINPTPNGRALAGNLIALDASGNVIGSDWDDDGTERIRRLVQWGIEQGLGPREAVRRAVVGLTDPADPLDEEAAGFITG